MYIVATMWGVLSVYAFVRWLQAEGWLRTTSMPKHRYRPGIEALFYVLATTAGLYTLYLFVTIVLIENIFLLVLFFRASTEQLRMLRRWATTQIATLALFAPWLVLAIQRMHSWSVATAFDFLLFVYLYATLLATGISTFIDRFAPAVLLIFLVLVAGAVVEWRSRRPSRRVLESAPGHGLPLLLLSLFLLVPPLVVYAVTRPRGLFYAPKVEARYLVLFAPAFCLLLAWSLETLRRRARWLGLGASVVVAAVFIWSLPAHYTGRYLRDEHQTMVRVIAAYAKPGDAVLLVSGSRFVVFDYYYGRVPDWPARPPVIQLPAHVPQFRADSVDSELAPLSSSYERLWLAQVNAPMDDPDGVVPRWLEQRYPVRLEFGFAHNALTLYANAGDPVQAQQGNLVPLSLLHAPLPNDGSIIGFDLPTTEFRPGDVARMGLYYDSPTALTATLRLADSRGRVLEERRLAWAPNSAGRQQWDVAIFGATPSGAYHYEFDSGDGRVPTLSFGALKVTGTQRHPQPTGPQVPMSIALNDGIHFLGYSLTDASGKPAIQVRAGDTVSLDLYWRASKKPSRSYTVFSHLVGQAFNPATSGPVWAGNDSQPMCGGLPTVQWFVDETVVDRHPLLVDPQAPPGDYELEIGMYLLETMERLPLVDSGEGLAGDRIVLGRISVLAR